MSHPVTRIGSLVELVADLDGAPTDRTVGTYRRRDGGFAEVSHRQLCERALRTGGCLAEGGVERGRPVIVLGRDGTDVLAGLLGAVAVGGLPVVAPARPAFDDADRAAVRLGALQTVLGDPVVAVVGDHSPRIPAGLADQVVRVGRAADGWCTPMAVDADDVAYLQMTSGSTELPKAVAVTHANLFANMAAIAATAGVRPGDAAEAVVSWLPLYHDMGLAGMALYALVQRIDLHLMAPFDFLADPMSWLRAMSDTRATMSAAPNFAYDLVLRRGADPAGLDLSPMRALYCGAEPISTSTLRAFARRFAAAGLSPDNPAPAYGLAESVLAVTAAPRGRPARSVLVDADELAGLGRLGDVEVVDVATDLPAGTGSGPGADDQRVEVCLVGEPVEGAAIDVLDADGVPVTADGVIGRIVVGGPSSSPGYRQADATVSGIDAESGIDTGDLGFWFQGELAIVERTRQVIIRHGHNHSSGALELRLARDAGVSLDRVVVLDDDLRAGRGRIAAIVEADRREDTSARLEVVATAAARLRPPVERVVIVTAGSLPRTTSGKKQHAAIRAALGRDELRIAAERDLVVEPVTGANPASGPSTGVDDRICAGRAAAPAPAHTRSPAHGASVTETLFSLLGEHLRRRGSDLVPALGHHLVDDLGVDSVEVLEIAVALEESCALGIDEQRLAEVQTVDDLRRCVEHGRGPRDGIAHRLAELQASIPQLHLDVADQRGRQVLIDGRWRTDFASCNYLGLDLHPDVAAAIGPMVSRWGTHPSWTRAVASPAPYRALEERLAEHVGAPDVVVFPTVTLLHAGVLPRLAGRGTVLVDSAAHASLHAAAALASAGGAVVTTFAHDDVAHLERRLEQATRHPVVVVVDGVYSMSGTTAPIQALAKACEAHGATLYVDDAHGYGVLGSHPDGSTPYGRGGRGVLAHAGIDHGSIVYVAGLSKAMSSMGAFVTCDERTRPQLRTADTLVFGGPVPVASLATALAGLDVTAAHGDELRRRLHRLTRRLTTGLGQAGHRVAGDIDLPIVNVEIGGLDAVARACQTLWRHDLVITPSVFPAMPLDRGGVRFTVTAANTAAEIDRAVEAMAEISPPAERG